MKNTFKKIAAILGVASMLFTCACGAKTNDKTTQLSETAAVQAEVTAEVFKEKLTDELKKAYLDIIKDYETRYGVYTEIFDEYDTKGYRGVYFCELFDWNVDGCPELMIGYTKNFSTWHNIEYLAVYGIEKGEVRQLLNEKYNHMHLSLDGSQGIVFAKGEDDLVRLVLANDEAEEWDNSGIDYLSYFNGEIKKTTLNAYGFSDEGPNDGDYFDKYTIDGRKVSFEEFDVKEKELGEMFDVVFIENIPYNNLMKFLYGVTDNYTNELFSLYDYDDEKHAYWVYETDFGYKTTF